MKSTNGFRWHELDAIRMIALLLGIVLHSALAYSSGNPHLWPIHDLRNTSILSVAVFVIHIFRMSVFFMIAGFFANLLISRRGLSSFWRNRILRIGLPLILGWIASIVTTGGVMFWLLTKENGGVFPESIPPDIAKAGFSWLHLWFLYHLLWVYACVSIVRTCVYFFKIVERFKNFVKKIIEVLSHSVLGNFVLALPIAISLSIYPEWELWWGVPTPGFTLIPPITPLFVFGYLFCIGWVVYNQPAILKGLSRYWHVRLLLGTVAAIYCLNTVGVEASSVTNGELISRLEYAIGYSTALILWTFTVVGLGVRYLSGQVEWIRYLSDASYWMYIGHFPIVMALQTALLFLELHWAVKFILVNTITCFVLIVMYRYWVRPTWIGVILNGRRHKPTSWKATY